MAHRSNGNGASSSGNWVIPIAVVFGVIQAIVGWTLGTFQANMSRIETAADAHTKEVKEEISARIRIIEAQFLRLREHEEFAKRLDANMARMNDRMDNTLAPRSEVDARLATNSNALAQVRIEIDSLKRDLGQTYSVKDALAAMQARIERMESWSRAQPPKEH